MTQTDQIFPLTRFPVPLTCRRLLSGSSMVLGTLNVLPRTRDVNRVWTWCKPNCRVWTWCKPNCLGSFHVNVKDSMWTIFQAQTAIKSVCWLVSNGWLVAEIWSFQVLGWGGAPKLSLLGLHAVVYVPTIKFRAYDSWFTSLDTWCKLSTNKVQTYLILTMSTWCKLFIYHQCKLWSNFV